MDAGKLSPRTFIDYDRVCRQLLDEFGAGRFIADLRIADFETFHAKLTKKYGRSTLGSQITMTRSVFKYAFEVERIGRPVKYGPSFKAPDKTEIRKAKAKAKHQHGVRTFAADEIRKMLDVASPQLRAMILLGINCGMGNSDYATLPESALDLKKGWLEYPRPKTGAERRCPLWPETVATLGEVLAKRRQPAEPTDAGSVFLTRLGQRWVRYEIIETKSYGKMQMRPKQDDAIAKATGKLLKALELKRRGLSFYSLRHTFETVAGGTADQVAVDAIMGHIDSSMAGNYRHHIEAARLQKVVAHVHDWLFAGKLENSPKIGLTKKK